MTFFDHAFDFLIDVNGFLMGFTIYDRMFKLDLTAPDVFGQMANVFQFILVVMFVQYVVKHYIKNHLFKERTTGQLLIQIVAALVLCFFTVVKLPV